METHPASMAEDAWNAGMVKVLTRRGRRPVVVPYLGYGSTSMLRVLGRVAMLRSPADTAAEESAAKVALDATRRGMPVHTPTLAEVEHARELSRRGWRNFISAEVARAAVTIEVADSSHEVRSDRNGVVDVRIPNPGLEPGWHEVRLRSEGGWTTTAAVHVIGPEQTFGIVSDIDDTVLRTLLPRPMLAAYNTFVLTEGARRAVTGMSELYDTLLAKHPDAPTIYVSTGAWNTVGTLGRFLARNGFPTGPLLMTAWGPTNSAWFRSGQAHKRASLKALARDLPQVKWVLIGDDGQHDPSLYTEFAAAHPDKVRAIALRQLSATEQVLAHGTATERFGEEQGRSAGVPEVRRPDGYGLIEALATIGIP